MMLLHGIRFVSQKVVAVAYFSHKYKTKQIIQRY